MQGFIILLESWGQLWSYYDWVIPANKVYQQNAFHSLTACEQKLSQAFFQFQMMIE